MSPIGISDDRAELKGRAEKMAEPKSQRNDEVELNLALVADLGGTYVRAAAIDSDGKIHFRLKVNTPQAKHPDEIVGLLVNAGKEGEKQGVPRSSIRAVSLAVPGTVDVQAGVVVKAPNLPCLDGFRLAAAVEREFELPVIIENDANAAAIGEMWQGAGRGRRTIVLRDTGDRSWWRHNPGWKTLARSE